MKYIDAEKLIAEIEHQKKHLSRAHQDELGAIIAYEHILSFIESLQQEQPSLPSVLDEAAKEWTKILYGNPGKSAVSISGEHGFKAGAEWMAGQIRESYNKND